MKLSKYKVYHNKSTLLSFKSYVDVAPGTSQTKWKHLRDRFVKEYTLQCAYIPSGSATIKRKSSWPLYETLQFLIPTIKYRKYVV